MENKKKTLQDIFDEDDDLGLLNIKTSATSLRSEDEKRLADFEEINVFFEKNQREPIEKKAPQEHQLATRLKKIRENEANKTLLLAYDKFNFLGVSTKKIESFDDIFGDDALGLLDDDDLGLFDLRHVKSSKDRESADFVAKRKPCADFDQYAAIFKQVQQDLRENKRKIVEFNLGNLREGHFYVHNGILFLLEKVEITKQEHYKEDGTRVRADGRTRCIFENGTESNMLKRSVEKILYANGKAISEHEDTLNKALQQNANAVTEHDQATGFIYVLRSKSKDEKIKSLGNVYKIGYSTTAVEDRIKNAEKEPTYLMAAVEIAATFECYNFNPQKMEQLLHNFFGEACLNIDIFDKKGQRHTPREWFVAPMQIIEQAVMYIISGEIVDYQYDFTKQK